MCLCYKAACICWVKVCNLAAAALGGGLKTHITNKGVSLCLYMSNHIMRLK
jgi:hypothetical protein